jgi:hypothetical protein
MKKVLWILAAVLVMLSCGSVEVSAKKEKKVKIPCHQLTNKQTLRANGNAVSPNMQNATDKAIAAARRELATSIEATINRVLEDFSSSYDVNEQADFRSRTKDLSRTVVSQKLQGSILSCSEMRQVKEKGGKITYHAYVTIELTSNELLDNLLANTKKAISDSEKLRTDFEYEQFKKTFDEEMAKLAASQE